ncbi:ribonuclease III [Thermincola ferriacetica]
MKLGILGPKIDELIGVMGLDWNSPELLVTALTHSSYAHENKREPIEHNQRLEFLGDAVLELVVSEYLYDRFPTYPEGVLTKMRAGIVCESSLASVARAMNLGQYILMGKGEERSGGRNRPSILADAMEAIFGAVYLDQGLETTKFFIINTLSEQISKVVAKGGQTGDYKTELQELVQQKAENTLTYAIIGEEGPDHNKVFTAGVYCHGKIWGVGKGKTKKEAEQAAAHDALEKIKNGYNVLPKGE